MLYLLFGPVSYCHEYAKEMKMLSDDYKIVKHPRDYLGLRDVKLIPVSVEYTKDYDLYKDACAYHRVINP